MSGKGYGSRDSVQAPLTLITAFGRLASSSTFGRSFQGIWDPLARLFDNWGFDRCLWGTDWTRAFAVVNYQQAVEPFLKTGRLSDTERAMLMGGACSKAYRWSPKKGW